MFLHVACVSLDVLIFCKRKDYVYERRRISFEAILLTSNTSMEISESDYRQMESTKYKPIAAFFFFLYN